LTTINLKTIYQGVLFIILFIPLIAFAQNKTSTTTITLKQVRVEAMKISSLKKEAPYSISVLNFKENQKLFQQLSLQEYLEGVPGLFSLNANNYAQDLRISLRGFGARSAFGIRGIKIIIDGIPETTPDGQGQIDNVPMGLIEKIEVLRGPQASFYGNAAGGVISIKTIDSLSENKNIFKSSFGNYNLQSYQFTSYLNKKNTSALIYLNNIQTDGFRKNSALKQKAFNLKAKHRFTDQSLLNFQFNYTDSPLAQDSGGLTKEETLLKWDMARQRNIDYDTYEKINQLKFGFNWEKKLRKKIKLNLFSFYSNRDFYGKLPFEFGGIIDLDRFYQGLGSSLIYNDINENYTHQIQFGIEYYSQNDFRKRYKNLNGVKGSNVFDQKENFDTTAIFLIDKIELNNWIIRSSLRHDNLLISSDNSKYNKYYNVINPSVGFTNKFKNEQYVFLNFSTSFETPTLSELSANPSGLEGFNLELNPSKAHSYEFGWKSYKSNYLIEANIFYIKSSNELLPYELEDFPGRSFYENTGETERRGFELFSRFNWRSFNLEGSFTYAKYSFKNEDYNDLPGIPGTHWIIKVENNLNRGWTSRLTYENVGGFYANNINTVFINSFEKTRFQIAKTMNFNSKIMDFSAGINNLLNNKYYDNIRLNAFGSRYYEPAPPRNFYISIALRL
jgi:iron complex outermembrane receptor protein